MHMHFSVWLQVRRRQFISFFKSVRSRPFSSVIVLLKQLFLLSFFFFFLWVRCFSANTGQQQVKTKLLYVGKILLNIWKAENKVELWLSSKRQHLWHFVFFNFLYSWTFVRRWHQDTSHILLLTVNQYLCNAPELSSVPHQSEKDGCFKLLCSAPILWLHLKKIPALGVTMETWNT